VQFGCSGTILLASPIEITDDTTLEANGQQVVISGGNSVRIFVVAPGAKLTLRGLSLANGRVIGPEGAAGMAGGSAEGAAILSNGGNVLLEDCILRENFVKAGKGGPEGPFDFENTLYPGAGGIARGAAIHNGAGGVLILVGCSLVSNQAIAGDGGTASVTKNGRGGVGQGGAISSDSGSVALTNCVFYGNSVLGGTYGTSSFSNQERGGDGMGGAVFIAEGYLAIESGAFTNNVAKAGVDNPSPYDVAAVGAGGAIYVQNGSFQIKGANFVANSASSMPGDAPGRAEGGGLLQHGGSSVITGCSFSNNIAEPASASHTGWAAPGSGGAILVRQGTMTIVGTRLDGNRATGGLTGGRGQAPSGTGAGGAIFGEGHITIQNCRISENTAQGSRAWWQPGSGVGGALYNSADGIMRIEATILEANAAIGGLESSGAKGSALGGSIFNLGDLILNGSSVISSAADASINSGSGTGLAMGGGIANQGLLNATNSTVSANVVAGTTAQGGAFSNGSGGTSRLCFVTLSGNLVKGNQAGNPVTLYVGGGTVALNHAVLNASGQDAGIYGVVTDQGYNLCSDGSGSFSGLTSFGGVDLKLGPLGYHGGPTPTIPLFPGSPAIDSGDVSATVSVDQRGHQRPYNGLPDRGAFEVSPPFFILGRFDSATIDRALTINTNGAYAATTIGRDFRIENVFPGTIDLEPAEPDFLFLPARQVLNVNNDVFDLSFEAHRFDALGLELGSGAEKVLTMAPLVSGTYRLLRSLDFLSWSSLKTNSPAANGVIQFTDTDDAAEGRAFYQAERIDP
jgi:hypothetical protein